ncbi:MAG: phage holin family protein [Propionibacteriaceae bacterium]|jgi:uncharacterized membrane protein YqjE|nr:phage holin family protein [Propionibacteriaceae bacterium]
MADQPSIAQLVKDIQTDVSGIVHDELALAKAEMAEQGKRVGKGAGLLGVGGYLAFVASLLLFVAISLWSGYGFVQCFGMDPLFSICLGFTCAGVFFLIIGGLFALAGKGKVHFEGPTKALDSQAKFKSAVKDGVAAGKARSTGKAG